MSNSGQAIETDNQKVNPQIIQSLFSNNNDKVISTPEQISQRKIFKVARAEDGTPEVKDGKVDVKLNLPVGEKISLNKLVENDPKKLFMNNSGSHSDVPKTTSLFSNVSINASLFNNSSLNNKPLDNKEQQVKKSEPSSKQSKASKIDQQQQKQKPTQQKKPQQEKPKSLFNYASSSNMFSGLTSSTSGGLFTKTGPSIFDFKTNVPPTQMTQVKKDDEGSQGNELYKQQSEQIDQSKVINDYVYDLPYNKLIEKVLIKFKKNSQQTIQNCTTTLEEHKQTKKVYLFIRSKQTKTILFQGQVIGKISNAKIINNKAQNLNITLVQTKAGKPLLASIKAQFDSVDSGNEFLKVFEAKLEDLKKDTKQ